MSSAYLKGSWTLLQTVSLSFPSSHDGFYPFWYTSYSSPLWVSSSLVIGPTYLLEYLLVCDNQIADHLMFSPHQSLQVPQTTSCVFGCLDLPELFITRATIPTKILFLSIIFQFILKTSRCYLHLTFICKVSSSCFRMWSPNSFYGLHLF